VAVHENLRAHVARVGAAFFVNGVAATLWLATTPELALRLGTSVGGLGAAFAAFPVGGIVGTRVAPWVVARLGAGPATVAAGFAIAGAYALRAIPTGLVLFVAAQFVAGLVDGVQDVAMNVEAVVVDSRTRIPVVNRLHGVWSIGAVVGGLIGAALAAADASVPVHFLAGAAVVGMLNVTTIRLATTAVHAPTAPQREPPRRWWHSRALLALAVMGVAVSLLEGAPLDWGTLYLADELDASAGAAATVTVTFTIGMVVSRLASDHLVHRFGVPAVLRVGATVAGFALATALLADRAAVAMVAWALIGAGVAAAYPAVFVAAGRAPGVPPGAGIGAIASVARSGFLLGPVLIGAATEAIGLRAALSIPLVAAVVIIVLAGAARRPTAGG
jgi:fucose permease